MIDGLRPYAEMKPSGLAWLGDVPAHWDVRRNGRLFAARRETGFPELPILEVSIRSGVRIRAFGEGGRKQEMGDRAKYQRAARGDMAYNMMRMWQGAVGVAPADGLVSPAYVVARPFPEVDAAYYAYLFRTAAYMREIDVYSRGIVPDRNRLYWESFKQMPSIYPPLDEQRLIVRFLDWHGAQTAKLIRAKKKLIALLNEQKQAIIQRVISRGLDTKVPLKASGVQWLGDIPQGWDVVRLRHLVKGRLTYGANSSAEFTNPEWPRYIRITDFRSNGSLRHETFRSLPPEAANKYLLETGDVLFARSGATVGKAFLVSKDTGIACHAGYLIRARVMPSLILPEYLFLFTQSQAFFVWKELTFNTATIQNIGANKYSDLPIALPRLNEQNNIIELIKLRLSPIAKAVANIEEEITFMHAFRARVISDVVTGKLDVRTAAASLPDKSDWTPVDEPTEGDDADELLDDLENEEAAA